MAIIHDLSGSRMILAEAHLSHYTFRHRFIGTRGAKRKT